METGSLPCRYTMEHGAEVLLGQLIGFDQNVSAPIGRLLVSHRSGEVICNGVCIHVLRLDCRSMSSHPRQAWSTVTCNIAAIVPSFSKAPCIFGDYTRVSTEDSSLAPLWFGRIAFPRFRGFSVLLDKRISIGRITAKMLVTRGLTLSQAKVSAPTRIRPCGLMLARGQEYCFRLRKLLSVRKNVAEAPMLAFHETTHAPLPCRLHAG